MTRDVLRAYLVSLAINLAMAGAIIGIDHALRPAAHDAHPAPCPPQPSHSSDTEGR